MDPTGRRRVGRLIQVAILLVGVTGFAIWAYRKVSFRERVEFQTAATATESGEQSLGPGDLRIYSIDSAVTVTLAGDRLLAGLSPNTVAHVRDEMERRGDDDTSGLGGSIARLVKRTVATAITTQIVYQLAEIRDIRHVNGQLVLEQPRGATTLFRNVKVDGSRDASRFSAEDAHSLREAVQRRKAELGQR